MQLIHYQGLVVNLMRIFLMRWSCKWYNLRSNIKYHRYLSQSIVHRPPFLIKLVQVPYSLSVHQLSPLNKYLAIEGLNRSKIYRIRLLLYDKRD